jgi:AcrR family transcriptional regulator
MAISALEQARQLRRNALKEQILAAAWELASSRGLRGLSLRVLADMLRIDHQRIYTHFRSKHDLYAALLVRQFPASRAEWDAVGFRVDDDASEGLIASPPSDDVEPPRTRPHQPAAMWTHPPTTAIHAIERCAADARRSGHLLGGFGRRCHLKTFRFVARCRQCGREMGVQRTPVGWICASEIPPCTG